MTDVAALIAGVLEDHRHKPPRVLARKIADHLAALQLLATHKAPTVTVDCQACQTPPPWGDPLDWLDHEQVVIYARHLERLVTDLMAERAGKLTERRRTA